MAQVEEFLGQIRKRSMPMAQWHKIDLHNHSPASHDFVGNKATAVEDYAKAISEKRLSVVMFTDHEKLPDTSFVEELNRRTGALVLAGLELNVFVDAFGKPADKVGKDLCFHLLVGFDPTGTKSPPSYWYEHLARTCRSVTRDLGDRKDVRGVASSIDEICESLKDSGAFVIPAHLHSGQDAFRTRSIDLVYKDSEFLRWARHFFTALDVRNDRTAAFFDGKHAEAENIEVSCIRSSDAHKASDLGSFPSWVQMENLSFAELKAALELPSRVSRGDPPSPPSYVMGINIEGAFLRDFWMSFSPHSNVLIGVKGSGKTSVLECLRFALGTEVPKERSEEVAKHLSAILGAAGRVRVLVKRDDGAKVLVERRITDKKFTLTFEDDRQVVLDTPDGLRFSAAILGWHEIEHAATDRQIRRLHMDAIAGKESVNLLTNEASLLALSIKRLHESATAKYNEYVQLASTVQQQEALRAGLQQLKDANLIELRDHLSVALADRQEISRVSEHLSALPSTLGDRLHAALQIDEFKFGATSPLARVTGEAQADIRSIRSLADNFLRDAGQLIQDSARTASKRVARAKELYDEFASQYRDKLGQLPPEVQRLLESHREVLEKTKDLPNLRARLADLKADIDRSLAELADTCEKVARKLDERLNLRAEKVTAFNKLLSEAEVTLAVIPGTSREDEFSTTFNEYGHTREAYHALRALHSGPHRFHRTLSQGYTELRRDLNSGDRVIFARTEFSYVLTVLENDDLEIKFAVGKPGELYSPIDQLSAGQRCTAVFPILLKLKEGPLVIDQPEDNLDNRHIARSVAPVLVEDKRMRQIVMTSHNANLVVLSDPESISVFDAEHGQGKMVAAGFLAHRDSTVTSYVLDILDGGEKALELRSKKYGKQQ